jgi:PBP1b-binding outer membrane lipoprotein LpoB
MQVYEEVSALLCMKMGAVCIGMHIVVFFSGSQIIVDISHSDTKGSLNFMLLLLVRTGSIIFNNE